MSKYRLNINMKEDQRDFYIMNRQAKYFKGLRSGEIIWSDDINEAKVFNEPDKVVAIRRWKTQENIEIVYTDGK